MLLALLHHKMQKLNSPSLHPCLFDRAASVLLQSQLHTLDMPVSCCMQVEFGLPDLESRAQIFQIHTRTMNCERDIRFELLARLCPNSTGADIRSVCTEAGMYAIRARRKTVTEKDFLESVNKVCLPLQDWLRSCTTRLLQVDCIRH